MEQINELTYGMLKKLDSKGYVIIYLINENIWYHEHRWLVEKKIGRKLNSEESIHHINEDKRDNRIENLFPFHSQKEHARFHTKVKQFGFTKPIMREIRDRWRNYDSRIYPSK